MTLYLKYRPQSVDELDLVSVKTTLVSLLEAKSLPHAFLFTGPRGLGKTSAARIVAKTVNCTAPTGKKPCGTCDQCLGITAGSDIDVVEIDAASNRGIDEIRSLREQVKLAPMRSKYKVYIIDEVHMLTTEAANALLKTLEEPPGHVLFILCTTESSKLPETVISRCQVVNFQKASLSEIVQRLHQVAQAENFKVDESELEILAKAAKGGFRDAIKLLEHMILTGQTASQTVGSSTGVDLEEFITALQAKDAETCLKLIDQIVITGTNIRLFIEHCVEYLRHTMLDMAKAKNSEKLTEIIAMITDLSEAYIQTKDAVIPQLPLEMVVLKSARSQGPRVKDETTNIKPQTPNNKKELGTTKKDLEAAWPEVLKTVKPFNHSVEGLLRSTKILDFDGTNLTLEVFYQFHKDKLETSKCREIVENGIAKVLGVSHIVLKLKLSATKPASAPATSSEDLMAQAQAIFTA